MKLKSCVFASLEELLPLVHASVCLSVCLSQILRPFVHRRHRCSFEMFSKERIKNEIHDNTTAWELGTLHCLEYGVIRSEKKNPGHIEKLNLATWPTKKTKTVFFFLCFLGVGQQKKVIIIPMLLWGPIELIFSMVFLN